MHPGEDSSSYDYDEVITETHTWHHHQDNGRMQLVPEWEHSKTGHIGGDAMQGGK
ncbi:HNH endonuclease [Acinetobacter baumannii]